MGHLTIELVLVMRLVLLAVTGAGQHWLAEDRARPVELPEAEAARVAGQNLRAVRACHVVEQRAGLAPVGKLLVTLDITSVGKVADVRLDGSVGSVRFAECVKARARAWLFPRVRTGPTKRFTFPVVFLPPISTESSPTEK
jgi:hypothetical protein